MTHETPTDQQLEQHVQRAATVRSIADLAGAHGLPMPQAITMHGHSAVQLRLDDEDYAGVAAWAAALDLGRVHAYDVPKGVCNFVSVKAERYFDGPGWVGWSMVDVWSACWRDMPARDDVCTSATTGGAA